ncbi:uncharacterized protein LOC144468724 isoform X2 [Augochlora pura]
MRKYDATVCQVLLELYKSYSLTMSHLNLFYIVKKMNDFTSALEWVRELGLIPTEKYCGKHKNKMMYVEVRGRLGRFRCRKMGKYDHWITAAHNTWFERCHLSIEACMIITYGFAWKFSFELMQHECSIVENETVSSETISDRFSFCREVCTLGLDRRYEMEGSIGGPGVIVEIDECKVGRRKFEKGRIREGVWILGMIERGGKKYRLEICPDNKRDEITLISLIKKHVEVGSEIHTDCWKGYMNLKDHGYIHKTVNHSTNFVDPDSGAYTQNIESSWRALRARLTGGGIRKDSLIDHMCEFLWRYEVKQAGKDPFLQLIDDIKYIYSGN